MRSFRIGVVVALACILVADTGGCRRADPAALKILLRAAIQKRDLTTAQRLLAKGADVNAAGENGFTPLMQAAGRGDPKMVKLLLDHGANARAKDSEERTALYPALLSEDRDTIQLLLAGIDQKGLTDALLSTINDSPVVMYIGGDKASPSPETIAPSLAVTLLIEKGADMNARDEEGSTPLADASSLGQLANVKALVAKGADIEARDIYGNTPLLAAACDCARATMNDTDVVVDFLLTKGADINARNKEGNTALMIASGGGVVKTRIVKILIDHGADLHLRNSKGQTALMIAEVSRLPDVIQLLKGALARHA
jgi:ankyrin repeat protein